MTTVNIHEAKVHLSKLIDRDIRGEAFLIAKAGRPLVKGTALGAPSAPRRLGFLAGEMVPNGFDRLADEEIETLIGGDVVAPPERAEFDDVVRRARAAARKAGMKPADVERAVAKARTP